MFLETSALTGENVEEAFLKCARTILNKIESGTAALIWLFQAGEGRVPGGLGGFGSLGDQEVLGPWDRDFGSQWRF